MKLIEKIEGRYSDFLMNHPNTSVAIAPFSLFMLRANSGIITGQYKEIIDALNDTTEDPAIPYIISSIHDGFSTSISQTDFDALNINKMINYLFNQYHNCIDGISSAITGDSSSSSVDNYIDDSLFTEAYGNIDVELPEGLDKGSISIHVSDMPKDIIKSDLIIRGPSQGYMVHDSQHLEGVGGTVGYAHGNPDVPVTYALTITPSHENIPVQTMSITAIGLDHNDQIYKDVKIYNILTKDGIMHFHPNNDLDTIITTSNVEQNPGNIIYKRHIDTS